MKTFDLENFETSVLESDLPVLVGFWSPTCRPCCLMTSVLQRLEEDLQGKAVIGKVNTSQNLELAKRYGVTGLPTFFVFFGGKVISRCEGITPKEKLKLMVESSWGYSL